MPDELRSAAPRDLPPFEGPSDRTGGSKRAEVRSAERLTAALATIAGFVDAYGMITYGVYVSFMSGNTTQAGYQAAEGAFGPASLFWPSSLDRSPGLSWSRSRDAMRGRSSTAWSRPLRRRSSA